MIGLVAALLGSKAGRIAAMALLAAASLALLFWQVFRQGRASEQARQTQASLEALRNRIRTDDKIAKMSPAARRRELAGWVRDRE